MPPAREEPERSWTIPADRVAPEVETTRDDITKRLRTAGIHNVLAVYPPRGALTDWTLYLQAGGSNAEARAALAAIPGVGNVRGARQSGSIVTFTVDRPGGEQA